MLYFYCAAPHEVKSIRNAGLSSSAGAFRLLERFEEAVDQCGERILVIDALQLDDASGAVRSVPPAAIQNVDPYVHPTPVTAAGGFVTRRSGEDLELLLIFRRGRWDLPKGKRDVGESVDDCALREVREELGIDDVVIARPLGSTVHGYHDRSRYMVKTTHWFEMSTTADSFRPQAEEDIEAARWMLWDEAREKIGFESLRRHMGSVRDLL